MSDTTLFMVLSNAVEGKDAEYNEWYDNVHVHDVLAVPGMVSCQRFTLCDTEMSRAAGTEPTHKYLAVYEMKGDPDTVMAGVQEAAASGAMAISDALDIESAVTTFWTPSGPKVQP
jgi:hypothetical protein